MHGPSTNNEPVVDHWSRCGPPWSAPASGSARRQWDLATDCPGWTVKDQLSHLIGDRAMLLGEPPPPPLAEVARPRRATRSAR